VTASHITMTVVMLVSGSRSQSDGPMARKSSWRALVRRPLDRDAITASWKPRPARQQGNWEQRKATQRASALMSLSHDGAISPAREDGFFYIAGRARNGSAAAWKSNRGGV